MTEMESIRAARGSVYLVIQSVITTVIGAVAFAVIARALTQTEMGVLVALNFTLSLVQIITDLGFSNALTRYIAEYRGRKVDYTAIAYAGVLIKLCVVSLTVILYAFTTPWLSKLFLKSEGYTFLFQLLSIDLLLFCTLTTTNAILLGINKLKQIAILGVASAITRQVFVVFFLLSEFGLAGLILGWIFGDLIYVTLSAFVIVRGRHLKVRSIADILPHLRMLAKFSWPLFITGLNVFFYNWFDRAVLLAYMPLTEVAIYSVALQAFTVLNLVPVALRSVLLPYYSEQFGRDRRESIATGVRGATRYIALLYTPLALGLAATSSPIITLFAGPKYVGGDVILVILCLLGAISGISAAFGGLLLVYNRTSTVLLINIVSVGFGVATSTVLLPFLGASGMALVRGATPIVSFILIFVALRKLMPVEFDREAIWKSWSAAIIMFLAVALLMHVWTETYLLAIYILLGGAVYALVLRNLGAVNENDIQLIRNLLGKRGTLITDIIRTVLM